MPNPSNRPSRPKGEAGAAGLMWHVVGFDDAPFDRNHRGDVLVVGAVFAGERLDGVISTQVRRDGANAAQRLIDCLTRSKYYDQLQAILLQGIAFAGFNVVDLQQLRQATGLPVLVVSRHLPDFPAIRDALLRQVAGGGRKWRLIQAAGPMEHTVGLYVQRCGITPENTARLLTSLRQNSHLPEPLRVAHMIAGGVATGESRHRA
jgi:endonuclease V-like protein UPF0215 family